MSISSRFSKFFQSKKIANVVPSLAHNLLQNDHYILHHTLQMLLHYLVKP